jgi:ligand-binding SRPBCC domain-containing protein
MRFVLSLGVVRVPWVARYSDVSPRGFTDIQLRGPYSYWRHRHTFVPLDDARTEVVDEVEAQLATNPLQAATGLLIWLGLPALFAYRTRKTRGLLAKPINPSGSRNNFVYRHIASVRSRGNFLGDGWKRG